MKRTTMLTFVAPMLLLLAACSTTSDGPTPAGTLLEPDETPVPLYAGQSELVGQVHASDDGTTLTVRYEITEPGWCLVETHLAVAGDVDDLASIAGAHAKGGRGKGHDEGRGRGHEFAPGRGHDEHHDDRDDDDHEGERGGNPSPGQFPYHGTHACESEVVHEIPLSEIDDAGEALAVAAHAVVRSGATTTTTDTQCSFAMYGIEQGSGALVRIDDVPGQVFEEVAVFPDSTDPDALALDGANQRLYFAERTAGGSTLHLYDLTSGTFAVAGDLGGTATGAAFHDGGYYYVPRGGTTLQRVEFAADGTVASEVAVESFVPNEALGVVDLAIEGGVLYGSTTAEDASGPIEGAVAQFFSFDLASGTFATLDTWGGGAFLQLAFDASGTLYGTYTDSNVFYEIDPASGGATQLEFWPQLHFTDLASGAVCESTESETPPTDGEVRSEGAWAGEKPFPGASNWATYFVYALEWPENEVDDVDDGKDEDEVDEWEDDEEDDHEENHDQDDWDDEDDDEEDDEDE